MSAYDPLDCTTPQETGALLITRPLIDQGDTTHFIAAQNYYVLAQSYVAPTLNSTKTVLTVTAYCVGDTTPTPAEAGLVSYTRRWSTIPATNYEPSTYACTLPGIDTIRDPVPSTIPARVKSDYYMVGAGLTYTTFDAIPVVVPSVVVTSGAVGIPLFSGGFYLDGSTTPTASTYQTAIGTDVATPTSYSYVATTSELVRYAGNIWQRKTLYVKAR